MRILFVHNDYGRFSGEEHAVESISRLLVDRGHTISWFRRSSAGIGDSLGNKIHAFGSGIYSFSACRDLRRQLQANPVDIVQVQNIYPFISASVFPELRRRGIPIVMRCPNYRLMCPNGLHLSHGEVCERCLGGREWNCVLRNCERDRLKSLGYAARNAFARITRMIVDNVDVFAVLTEFQKDRFIAAGIPADRLAVLPNVAPVPDAVAPDEPGGPISFVGRAGPEKGLADFVAAARKVSHLPFAVAGCRAEEAGAIGEPPANVTFHGFLSGKSLDAFYAGSRLVVCPSKWFEGFPNVVAAAMARGKAVIAARIGAMPEIVDDGVTGLLFAPGDIEDLSAKIETLANRPELRQRMGVTGRKKAHRDYSETMVYDRLMAIHQQALDPSHARRSKSH